MSPAPEQTETPETARPAPPGRRWRRFGVVVLVALLCGVIIGPPLLRRLPRLLIRIDADAPADVLICLGGGNGSRVDHAVALLKAGRSRSGRLILVGGPLYGDLTWSDVMARRAKRAGVEDSALLLGRDSLTTRGDARDAVALMRRFGYQSAVVVTDAWHSRRACHELEALAPELEFRSRPVAAPAGDWWDSDAGTRFLVSEMLKWCWPGARRPAESNARPARAERASRSKGDETE